MRTLFAISALFISGLLTAQNDLDMEFQEYISDYRSFDIRKLANKKFEHSLARLSIDNLPSYRRDTCFVIVERELDFDITESVYRVVLNYVAEDNSLRQNNYKLHVLRSEHEIIGIVSNNRYLKKTDTYFDTERMKDYVTRHDSLYQTTTRISDFIEGLTMEKVYGYHCGMAPRVGDVPEAYGYKFNDIKNISVFRQWIRSYSLELQTYGADAISYLYNQTSFSVTDRNKRLAEYDRMLIEHIKKRNSVINTCSGSIIGIYEKAYPVIPY